MDTRKALSKDEKQRINALYKKGKLAMEIAKQLNRKHTTVWNYLVRNGIHVSSQPVIKKREKPVSKFFDEHEFENWLV